MTYNERHLDNSNYKYGNNLFGSQVRFFCTENFLQILFVEFREKSRNKKSGTYGNPIYLVF